MASPFRVGEHGGAIECQVKYEEWLLKQKELLGALPTLSGKKLVCDCPLGQPCNGDVLAAWADEGSEKGIWRREPLLPRWCKRVQLVSALLIGNLAAGGGVVPPAMWPTVWPPELQLRYPQHAIDRRLQRAV